MRDKRAMKDKKKLYAAALRKWGLRAQLGMLQEECAEAIVAVSKFDRQIGSNFREAEDHLCEEIADVEIMIEQIREVSDWSDRIDRHKTAKLARLACRLEAATEHREGESDE